MKFRVLIVCVFVAMMAGCKSQTPTVATSLASGVAAGAFQAMVTDPNSVVAQKLVAALKENPKLAALLEMAKTVNWADPNSVKAYGTLVGVTLATSK